MDLCIRLKKPLRYKKSADVSRLIAVLRRYMRKQGAAVLIENMDGTLQCLSHPLLRRLLPHPTSDYTLKGAQHASDDGRCEDEMVEVRLVRKAFKAFGSIEGTECHPPAVRPSKAYTAVQYLLSNELHVLF